MPPLSPGPQPDLVSPLAGRARPPPPPLPGPSGPLPTAPIPMAPGPGPARGSLASAGSVDGPANPWLNAVGLSDSLDGRAGTNAAAGPNGVPQAASAAQQQQQAGGGGPKSGGLAARVQLGGPGMAGPLPGVAPPLPKGVLGGTDADGGQDTGQQQQQPGGPPAYMTALFKQQQQEAAAVRGRGEGGPGPQLGGGLGLGLLDQSSLLASDGAAGPRSGGLPDKGQGGPGAPSQQVPQQQQLGSLGPGSGPIAALTSQMGRTLSIEGDREAQLRAAAGALGPTALPLQQQDVGLQLPHVQPVYSTQASKQILESIFA